MTTVKKLEEIIDELVELVIMLEDENRNLREQIERVKTYIEVYEEYIMRGNDE